MYPQYDESRVQPQVIYTVPFSDLPQYQDPEAWLSMQAIQGAGRSGPLPQAPLPLTPFVIFGLVLIALSVIGLVLTGNITPAP